VRRLLLIALLVAITSGAAAGEPKKKRVPAPKRLEYIESLLPYGWTLTTDGLPQGVSGLALGPEEKGTRPVMILTRVDDPPPLEELLEPRVPPLLGEKLHARGGGATVSRVERGPLAGVQVSLERDDALIVRHLLLGEGSQWLLTVVGRKAQVDAALELIAKLAQEVSIKSARKL
jgi:hypothetical protein